MPEPLGVAKSLFHESKKAAGVETVDEGMVSLLVGESVTLHIATTATADPDAFAAANVLRSANDLKREW